MVLAYPQRPDDGKDYEWNEEEYRWIERPSNKARFTFGNWLKTGLRLGTADGEAWGDLLTGNTDKLAYDAEHMSAVEVAANIGMLVATFGAGALGARLGKGSIKPKSSKSKLTQRTPTPKEIDSFVAEYNTLSPRERLNVLEQSVDYKQKQYQVQTEQARLSKDTQAYNELLKEGDEFMNNEYSPIKREVKQVAYEAEKARSEEQALERETERQALEDIDQARDNEEVMNEWYEQYGTNEEGVDTDLQELGRRVMGMLDPDGLGEIELPQGNMGQWTLDNISNTAERRAIERAYNDPRIWNTLKANYKKSIVAGGAGTIAGVAGAVSSQDTNEITVSGSGEDIGVGDFEDTGSADEDDEPDVGDMDLDESLEPPPKDTGGTVDDAGMSGTGSGSGTIGTASGSIDGQGVAPSSAGTGSLAPPAQDTAESLPAVQENIRNVDELVQRCLELCKLSYRDKENFGQGYSWIRDDIDFPVLFHETNRRLFITFRGTQTWQNALTDLDLTSVGTPETPQEVEQLKEANFLYTFDNLNRHLTTQFSTIEMHQGFLKSLNDMYENVIQKMNTYTVDEVIFTGHSAGGALASMMYYVYQNDTRFGKLNVGNCVPFASPRFLFENYLDLYNINCPEVIRVWNLYDPVPYVPLHQPLIGVSTIVDGYAHVGKSLCLNGKGTHNNPNRFIYNILKNGQASLPQIMKLQKMGKTNALIDFMLDPRYESALFDTTIRCLQNVSVKNNVSKQAIASVVANLNRDMEKIQEYQAKCMLAQPFGIAEILQEEKLGESEEQQNWGIISRVLMSMLANQSFSKEHDLEVYDELLQALKVVEIEQRKTLFESASMQAEDVNVQSNSAETVGNEERFVQDLQTRVQMVVPEPLGMIEIDAENYIGQVVEYQ